MRFKAHYFAGIALVCSFATSGFGQSGCPNSTFQNCSSCVVVKNDSLRDCLNDGQAVTFGLQAWFNGNEEANVWLTSPCDGNIVAIQILWASPGRDQAQFLEQSITIFDTVDSQGNPVSWPDRGTVELIHSNLSTGPAIITSPALTDGILNEFPEIVTGESLRVPVTNGQVFIVSFNFSNNICTDTCSPSCGTPLTCFGPTIGIDIDGCQAGRNGVNHPGGFDPCAQGMEGDFVIRAIVECSSAAGACCLPDGTCDFISPEDCANQQGEFQGAAVSCASITCDPLVGACCTTGPLACTNTTIGPCQISGGTWLGSIANGFDCNAGDPCNLQGLGACCVGEGCFQLSSPDCASAGGSYKGLGTDCATSEICIPKGACCFATGFCIDDTTESFCLQTTSNVWLGEGIICAGDGTPDSACPPPCPTDCAALQDGNTNVTDLLALLAGWGLPGSCDMAPPGGDGTINVTDLLALLAAWGPCQ